MHAECQAWSTDVQATLHCKLQHAQVGGWLWVRAGSNERTYRVRIVRIRSPAQPTPVPGSTHACVRA